MLEKTEASMSEIEQLKVSIEVPRWKLEQLGQYLGRDKERADDLAFAILQGLAPELAQAFQGRDHWFPTPMVRLTLTIEKPPREGT